MASKRHADELPNTAALSKRLELPFSGKVAVNRFVKASMTERLSSWHPTDLPSRGIPSQELINLYRAWGQGGFGMIVTGNVMLDYNELEAAGNAIIPPDAPLSGERFDAFAALAQQGKANGALVIAQLSHPGRQVAQVINQGPISASDVQLEGELFGLRFAQPRAMGPDDFKRVIDSFAHAASFSCHAGFDGVEVQAAHGYLLAQFLAPSTNHRTDTYGGSLTNRSRLLFEILAAIRRAVTDPTFLIGVKLNSVEFQSGGFSSSDSRDLCVALEAARVDFLELSGGTYQELALLHKRDSSRQREAYFLSFADKIVPRLRQTRVIVTGGLRTAAAMVKALDTVHTVGLGRPAAHERGLPKKILAGHATGAPRHLLDEQDFGLTNFLAGAQMRRVAYDLAPLDMTLEENNDAFLLALQEWGAASADPAHYGFPVLPGS